MMKMTQNITLIAEQYGITIEDIERKTAYYLALRATTKEGYAQVKQAYSHAWGTSVAVEKRRKELKADSLEYGRQVDSTAKAFQALWEPIISHLKAEKTAVDEAEERKKEEKRAAERAIAEAKLRAEIEAADAIKRETEAAARAEREAEQARQEAILATERARLAEIAEVKHAEALRLERIALMSDKEKFWTYCQNLLDVLQPDLTTLSMHDQCDGIRNTILRAQNGVSK